MCLLMLRRTCLQWPGVSLAILLFMCKTLSGQDRKINVLICYVTVARVEQVVVKGDICLLTCVSITRVTLINFRSSPVETPELSISVSQSTWWRHDRETFSALLALCEGNPPMTGGFPSQKASNAGLVVYLMYAWANGWANSGIAGDLRHHDVHVTGKETVQNERPVIYFHTSQITRNRGYPHKGSVLKKNAFPCCDVMATNKSKLRIIGFCERKQRWPVYSRHKGASNAESVFMPWRHHESNSSWPFRRRLDEKYEYFTLYIWLVNSLWPGDVIWRHKPRTKLAQAMACCLTAPSHYLNQCCLITKCVLWHWPESNFTRNAHELNP